MKSIIKLYKNGSYSILGFVSNIDIKYRPNEVQDHLVELHDREGVDTDCSCFGVFIMSKKKILDI